MAATYGSTRDYPASAGYDLPEQNKLGAALDRFLVRIGLRSAEWRRYRQTVAELRSLSDRELADIGISRWQIQEVAKSAASNDRRAA